MTVTLLDLIDRAQVEDADDENRKHLGGSLIGRKCNRALWYTFRWAAKEKFEGRMLRLFDRGQREEFQFVKYLRRAGINVREYSQSLWWSPVENQYMTLDWDADLSGSVGAFEHVTHEKYHVERAKLFGVELKQWRILDVQGHFGGSEDGQADAPSVVADKYGAIIPANEDFICEFKTHNTKSFQNLVALRVKEAKPDHWNQMQVYMFKERMKYALYMAVNKNDDDMHIEIVHCDPAIGAALVEKARLIIHAKQPPQRISSNPSFFDCKWCFAYKVCHYAEPVAKSCRTCKHSTPVEAGEWHCGKWNQIIPSEHVPKACDRYEVIHD